MASVTINTIAGDDVVDYNEYYQSLTISGSAAGAISGSRVNLTLDGMSFYTYLDQGSLTWSITIPDYDVANLTSGVYTVHAQAYDTNINQITTDRTLTVDLANVAISTIAGDNVISAVERQSPITISGAAGNADGQVVIVHLNGKTYDATVANSAWSVSVAQSDVAALSDGTYAVTADIDVNGASITEAVQTLVVHATPPTIAISPTFGDDGINAAQKNQTVVLSGTATGADGQVATIGLNGETYQTTIANGAWSVSLPNGDTNALTDGPYTITADVTDQYGNAATEASRSLVVQTTAPTVAIGTIDGDDMINAAEQQHLTLAGTAVGADGQVVTVVLDGFTFQSIVTNGAWSVQLGHSAENALTDGTYTVTADVSDQYGNAAAEASRALAVHTTPPTVTIATIAGDDALNAAEKSQPVVLTGTATGAEGQVVTLGLNGEIYQATVTNGAWSVFLPQGDANALGDGPYTVTADVTDQYGNAATEASRSLVVQTTPPTIAIATIAGDDVINAAEHGAALTVAGTATGADRQTVTVGLNGQSYTATVSSGAWLVTVPQGDVAALSDAITYGVTANVTDAYGNAASPASHSVLVATALPTLSANPIAGDNIINLAEHGQAQTISGSESLGSTVSVTLNGHSYTTTPNGSAWSVTIPQGDIAALTDGTYTVTETATSAYGNVSAPTTLSLLVDTTPPTLTIGTVASDDVINATEHEAALTVTGTASGAEGRTVTVGFGLQTYTATVTNGTWSVVLPQNVIAGLVDGSDTISADVSDAAGNAATEAVHTITVDTAAPTVTIATIAGDDAINIAEIDAPVTIAGTAAGVDGRLLTVTLNNHTYSATVAGGRWSVSVPVTDLDQLYSLDTYSVNAAVSNTVGNVGTSSRLVSVQTVSPEITIDAISTDDVINATEHAAPLTLSGTAPGPYADTEGGTVTIGLGGHVYQSIVTSSDTWSVQIGQSDVAALADGTYTVTADVSDPYGNPAIQATRSLLVDTAPPTITIPTIAGDNVIDAAEHGSSIAIHGSGSSASSVTLTLAGHSYTVGVNAGAWTATLPASVVSALADGSYAVTAQATDSYGNVNTATSDLVVDTAPPTLAISTIAGDDTINATEFGAAVTLAGTATGADGQTVTIGLNGETYTATVVNGAWSATVPQADVSDLEDGIVSVTASVTDVYGNGTATALRNLLVATSVPLVTMSAITGDDILNAVEHGAAVTISGTAARAGGSMVTVSFGGQSYSAAVSHGAWSVTIPQGQVSALPDGPATVTASITDSHGNTSIPATRSLLVAATPPTVSIGTISSDDVLNASEGMVALTLSGAATGAEGRTVAVSMNNHTYSATVVNGSWSVNVPQGDVSVLADTQNYTVTANVTDQYGNTATPAIHSLLVATALPSVTVDPISGDGVINATEHGAALTVSGSATIPEGSATRPVMVTLNSRTYTTTASNGVWTLTVPQSDVALLGNGVFPVIATLSDQYGNLVTSTPRNVSVDTTLPTVTIGTIAGDDRINATEHGTALVIDGASTDDAGGTVTINFAGQAYTATAAGDGSWSVIVPQADVGVLTDGGYAVTAGATNSTGNQSATASRAIGVDTVALAPRVALVPGSTAANVSLTGTAEANALITLSIDGQNVGTTTAATDGSWLYALTGAVPDGPDTVTATQTDLAGNISAASQAVALPRAAADFATTDPDFDAAWYLAQNPDVAASGIDPLLHYENFGWKEGRDPNPWFNTNYYLNQNPDVAASGMDPLQQYEEFGWREGRDPSINFSTNAYLAANPDVAAAGMDPLLNYLHFGQAEGRMTFMATPHPTGPQDPLVEADYYYANNPAVAAAGLDPTAQFDSAGWQQGANPDPYFDVAYYLANNPDVAAAGVNPLLQYELYGWQEGRNPSASFSTNGYLAANPDVAAAHIDPLLQYIAYGQAEGRAIIPV